MNSLKSLATFFLTVVLSFATCVGGASEGGGESGKEGGGGNGQLIKVDAIVVNLMGPNQQYLQVEMILKLAKPEVADRVKLYMPVIRHKMILLLSGKDANQLLPMEGKKKLLQESKDAVNEALELTDKEGVTDVLFGSFIIQ